MYEIDVNSPDDPRTRKDEKKPTHSIVILISENCLSDATMTDVDYKRASVGLAPCPSRKSRTFTLWRNAMN